MDEHKRWARETKKQKDKRQSNKTRHNEQDKRPKTQDPRQRTDTDRIRDKRVYTKQGIIYNKTVDKQNYMRKTKSKTTKLYERPVNRRATQQSSRENKKKQGPLYKGGKNRSTCPKTF